MYFTACLAYSLLSVVTGFILPLTKVDGTLDVNSLLSHLNFLEQSVSDLHKQSAATRKEVTSLKGRVASLEADKQQSLNETSDLKTQLRALKLRIDGKQIPPLLKNTASTLRRDVLANKAEINSISANLKILNSSCVTKTSSNHSGATDKGVSFEVTATTTISSDQNEAVKFDIVQHNIGNGYNQTTGIFTVPVSGLYLFWVQFLQQHDRLTVSLYRSGKLEMQLQIPQPLSLSGVKSMMLTAGENVYVSISTLNYAYVYGYPHSNFGGVLLKH